MAIDFTKSAVVVAHPDDEVLWFSSVLRRVALIVICYGAISPNSERAVSRRKAMAAYPLDTVSFLDLPIPHAGASAQQEEEERMKLAARLSDALRGITTVFTHNPWGEYGQRDHLRVHAMLETMRAGDGLEVYVSSYLARHQVSEFDRHLRAGIGEVISFPVDRTILNPLVTLYKSKACWTWAPRWHWPNREYFFRLEPGKPQSAEIPVLLFGSKNKSRAEMRGFWRQLLPATPRERLIPIPLLRLNNHNNCLK